MHRIRSGKQRITVKVPSEPALAGIDPRNLLIDVIVEDNVSEITRAASRPAVAESCPRSLNVVKEMATGLRRRLTVTIGIAQTAPYQEARASESQGEKTRRFVDSPDTLFPPLETTEFT